LSSGGIAAIVIIVLILIGVSIGAFVRKYKQQLPYFVYKKIVISLCGKGIKDVPFYKLDFEGLILDLGKDLKMFLLMLVQKQLKLLK